MLHKHGKRRENNKQVQDDLLSSKRTHETRNSAAGSCETVRARTIRYRREVTIAAPRRLAGLKPVLAVLALYAYLLQSFLLGVSGSAVAATGDIASLNILCGIHSETDTPQQQSPNGTQPYALKHDCCLAANGAATGWSPPIQAAETVPFRPAIRLSGLIPTAQRAAVRPDNKIRAARAPPSPIV